MPTSTRIAIATLYIRFRDARRLSDRNRTLFGMGSVIANRARATEIATWNDLVSVKTNVYAGLDGFRETTDAKTFVSLVARRGAAFNRNAA